MPEPRGGAPGTDRGRWREQLSECALDPMLPIIDAHHHLWAVPRREQLEPYLPDALFTDVAQSGHNVIATIYVDAFANYHLDGPERLRAVGETVYADEVARLAERRGAGTVRACAGIVANADLLLGGGAGEVLDAHRAASPRLRGVRHMAISDPAVRTGISAGLLNDDTFRAGFAEVVSRGLTFDAAVFQSQLSDVSGLAAAFPGAAIVLNHIGTPLAIGRYADNLEETFAAWQRGMTDLAQHANVYVKIGGLNMPFTGLGAGDDAAAPLASWELAARQRRHVLTTIELFGADRCMFESNFPVDRWYTSYGVLWNAFKRIVADLSADERIALFAGTAARVYRLTLPSAMPARDDRGRAALPAG